MKSTLLALFYILLSINTIQSQETYVDIKYKTEQKIFFFAKEYFGSKNTATKDSIIYEARAFLLKDISKYFEAWTGTQWDFNGTSKIPRQGKIACGYFVTTVLQDMGFKIPRIKWAQLASENMIKEMTTDIKRFHKAPMSDVVKYIESKGTGLYIVGLDSHVGFIYYQNQKMTFVHSNYYYPKKGVMSEPLIGRNPLNDSKYRVIGKIFDNNMIIKWIEGKPFGK